MVSEKRPPNTQHPTPSTLHIMTQPHTSAAHTLRLWPVSAVARYAVVRSMALMVTVGKPHDLQLVPGTLSVTDQPDTSGLYQKRITFRASHPESGRTDLLDTLRSGYYVAVFTDESGHRRASGSPSYPLRLAFSLSDGLYQCTLEGQGTASNPYV